MRFLTVKQEVDGFFYLPVADLAVEVFIDDFGPLLRCNVGDTGHGDIVSRPGIAGSIDQAGVQTQQDVRLDGKGNVPGAHFPSPTATALPRGGNTSINARLEQVLLKISSEMSPEEIEKRSRVQHRGRFSDVPIEETNGIDDKKEENLVASEMAQSALGNVVSTNTSPKKDYELGYQLTIFDIMDQVQ